MEAKSKSRRDVLPDASRYELLVKIASGGMATVYVGRLTSKAGVRRLFAIKRAHAHLADDPVFRKMFVTEAKLAARIHHPNVVAVQDTEELDDELLLVMDYVEGATLADMRPLSTDPRMRVRLAIRILLDACAGLHAAHELRDESGRSLDIIHRDVSPQNILVGADGIARLTDFGIAKSKGHTMAPTHTGGLKGKLGYMAPEYVTTGLCDRRADVFALGVVLWESLTAQKLFKGSIEVEVMNLMARCEIAPASTVAPELPPVLEPILQRALAKNRADRYESARAFAEALEELARPLNLIATPAEVSAAVETAAAETLLRRRRLLTDEIDDLAETLDAQPSPSSPDHTHTQTLEPSMRTMGHVARPPLPSVPPATSRPLNRPDVRRMMIGAGVTVGTALATMALVVATRSTPPPPADERPAVPVPVESESEPPSTAFEIDDETTPTPAGVSPASLPDSPDPSRPDAGARRLRPSAPIRRPTPPAPGDPPGRAPPNPYRRGP